MMGELSPEGLEELVAQSVDILTVLDESGTIQYQNPAVERILGYAPTEQFGETVFNAIHPDDRQKAIDTFNEVVDASEGYTTDTVEIRFRHQDGSWVWLESRMSNQMARTIGGYVVSSRDITDRKQYERQLQREQSRVKRFAAFVSHDLRNPLNVAEGHLEHARENHDSPHLDEIARSLDRMNDLIDDILTLVREGEAEPCLDAVDLRETITACWGRVDTKAATLDIDTDTQLVADESQLQLLLENLLRNAVEHGGEDVTITVGALPEGFYVEDDGRGLPDSDRETLLEYGFSTTADGTGMGLAIVEEVVQTHGWTLTITESVHGGARFEITDIETVE